MQNLIFILKTVFASGLIVGVIGGIIGQIYSMFVPEHAHQIFSAAMVFAVLGAGSGMFAGVIVSIIFLAKQLAFRNTAILYATILGLVDLGIVIWWFFRG